VQSAWRVACVRIPRFPIGAVWRQAGEGRTDGWRRDDAEQLGLGLELGEERPAAGPERREESGAGRPGPGRGGGSGVWRAGAGGAARRVAAER
jgi:hypothetical protein